MSKLSYNDFQTFDPSYSDGKDIFNKEIIYIINNENKIFRTRILEIKTEEKISEIKIELFDDEDIFFYYYFKMTSEEYNSFKQQNNLSIQFEIFIKSIIELLQKSILQIDNQSIFLNMELKEEQIILTISQQLRLRKVEIYSLNFNSANSEEIIEHAQFRFNLYKNELMNKKYLYNEKLSNIEAKNPTFAKKLRLSVEESVKKYFNKN